METGKLKFTRSDVVGGTILGLLFGGILLLGGLLPLVNHTIPALRAARAAESWVPAQAYITNVEIKQDQKSRAYSVAASYRYRFNGGEYSGYRVGLVDMSDADPSWHRAWYDALDEARRNRQPVTVYVNPAHPGDALIDREMRWDRLLGDLTIAFFLGGFGLFVIVRMIVGKVEDPEASSEWKTAAESYAPPALPLRSSPPAVATPGIHGIRVGSLKPACDDSNDPVMTQLSWNPLNKGGSSFRAYELDVSPDRIAVKKTGASATLLVVFTLLGLGALIIGLKAMLEGEIVVALSAGGTGLAFLLTGLSGFAAKELAFDKRSGTYHRGRRPKSGSREKSGALSRIYALQVLPKRLRTRDSDGIDFNFTSYELNAVFKDGFRLNILDHGDLNATERSAKTLGEFLSAPIWYGVSTTSGISGRRIRQPAPGNWYKMVELSLADTDDPIAQAVRWEPMNDRGVGRKTHELVFAPGRVTVKAIKGPLLRHYWPLSSGFFILGAVSFVTGQKVAGVTVTAMGCIPFIIGALSIIGKKPLVFDKAHGVYFRGARYGEAHSRQAYDKGALSDLYAVQILGDKSRYELNMIFRDGERLSVMGHSNVGELEESAKELGHFLGIPVWRGV